MGELLLQGWTMLEDACMECLFTLMRSRKGEVVCVCCGPVGQKEKKEEKEDVEMDADEEDGDGEFKAKSDDEGEEEQDDDDEDIIEFGDVSGDEDAIDNI